MITAESRDANSTMSTLTRDASSRAARSLRRHFVWAVGAAATVVLGLVAFAGVVVLKRTVGKDGDDRVINAAVMSTQLVERVLAERSRQIELLAVAPSVITGARKGGQLSRDRGLPRKSIAELEQQFKATRSQQVDSVPLKYLTGLLPKLDIAEVM